MSKNAYPAEVRLFARGLFLQGNSYNEVAKLVKKQYSSARCNAETIRRWANQPDENEETWHDMLRAVSTKVKQKQKVEAVELLEKHSELYQLMINKGEAALRRKGIVPSSASEASGILDTGIKGQRASVRELVSLNFVKAVFQIVIEEVLDEAVRRRIALRFRELGEGQ